MVPSIENCRFSTHLPSRKTFRPGAILIYDRRLEGISPSLRHFIRQFKNRYGVKAGESLKSLDHFPKHFSKISKIIGGVKKQEAQVIALGGGSVGDFAGFVASVYHRGVDFQQIPTTWLAAIDSAHGGKTALNSGEVKNQLGTFHFASKIYLVKTILKQQDQRLERQAFAEHIKHALLCRRPWAQIENIGNSLEKSDLWAQLRESIEVKYSILKKDPKETKGIRSHLNLGHSMGHVFEVLLNLSHGEAVALGLIFALRFSQKKVGLSEKTCEQWCQLIVKTSVPRFKALQLRSQKELKLNQVKALLFKDKKESSRDGVGFVFLQAKGRPKKVNLKVQSLLSELKRQGFIR